MLTPKQEKLLAFEKVQMILKAFDAEPVTSKEFKFNTAINQRIDSWISEFEKMEPKPRTFYKPRSPFESPDLSNIPDGTCPF
jgi:hypothetical protein